MWRKRDLEWIIFIEQFILVKVLELSVPQSLNWRVIKTFY